MIAFIYIIYTYKIYQTLRLQTPFQIPKVLTQSFSLLLTDIGPFSSNGPCNKPDLIH